MIYTARIVYDEFIDANIPAIDWAYVSEHRVLSERQQLKYQRYIVWPVAVRTQRLGPKSRAVAYNSL